MGCNPTLTNIQRLLEAQIDSHYVQSAATAITATGVTELDCTGDRDPGFTDYIPSQDTKLAYIHVELTAVAGAPTTIDLCSALDTVANGGYIVGPTIPASLTYASATVAYATAPYDPYFPWHRFGYQGAATGNVIVRAQLSAGTATCTARVVFITKTPKPLPYGV